MLSQLRSPRYMKIIMGIVAVAFIVGTIILTYDPFGGGGRASRQGSVALVINGEEVAWQSYSSVVNQLAEIERSRYQRDDLTTSDYERIEQQAKESVVTDVLMRQEANRMGLTASDDEIIATLTQNPPDYIRQRFLDDKGQFDPVQYQRALADPTYPWRADEEYLRNALPTLKLQQMVRARAVVSEVEVRREFQRRNMRNTVRYTGIAWRSIEADDFAPTDDELRQYQQEHADRFQKRETVSLEMLRVPKTPSSTDREEILEDARQDLQDLNDGVYDTFAELAAFASEDDNQGLLGWTSRSGLADTLASLVWSLQPGQHTDPILTNRGVTIVHVDSVRTEDGERRLFLHQVFMALTPSLDTIDSLRATALDLADDAKVDFDAAAREYGLDIETPAPLTSSGFLEGFGFSSRLRDWAFEAAPGAIGGPFASNDAWIMVRVLRQNPAELLPFDQVEDRLRNALLEKYKKDEAHRRVEAVRQAIDSGKSLQEAAADAGLDVKEPAPFTFYESVAGIGNANAFTAVASELAAGQISGVVDVSSGSWIVELISRDTFDEEQYAQEHDSHYQVLFQQRANAVYDAWLSNLRQNARIEDKRGPRV
jgi:peptidyl-prolyl cis-trans isomerase D